MSDVNIPENVARGGRSLSSNPGRIGRFEVRRLLGEGAFARVYLAFDPELEREVAVKVPNVEELTQEFRDAFLRENRLAAIIHHPNICPVYEVGTDGGRPYIVMRMVPDTLAGLLRRLSTPMPPRAALAITRKLALGLAAAHAQKIIHRDLKPANVLYDEANREVLLADFGLARFVDQATAASNGVPKGTPAYMSPEQARGKPDAIGPHSDTYSLGVILYEMLTGHIPFAGSVWEVMRDHCETLPKLPSSVRTGLDTRLDAICMKALAKKPADRYHSAKEFAAALADYLRGGEAVEEIEALPIAETLSDRAPVPAVAPATEVLELPEDTTPSLPKAPRRPVPPPLPPSALPKSRPPAPPPLPKSKATPKPLPLPPEGTATGTKLFFAGFGLLLLCGAVLGLGFSLGLFSKKPEPTAPTKKPDTVIKGSEGTTPTNGGGPKTDGTKEEPKIDEPIKPGGPTKEARLRPIKPGGDKPSVPTKEDRLRQAELDYQRGLAYFSGTGEKQDFSLAREWWEKAADAGHAHAQNDLGTLYHKGDGGPQDYVKARELYEKAAAQGNANAQNNLGIVYEFGLSVKADAGVAEDWYRKAAANGSDAAKKALMRFEKSPEKPLK